MCLIKKGLPIARYLVSILANIFCGCYKNSHFSINNSKALAFYSYIDDVFTFFLSKKTPITV